MNNCVRIYRLTSVLNLGPDQCNEHSETTFQFSIPCVHIVWSFVHCIHYICALSLAIILFCNIILIHKSLSAQSLFKKIHNIKVIIIHWRLYLILYFLMLCFSSVVLKKRRVKKKCLWEYDFLKLNSNKY